MNENTQSSMPDGEHRRSVCLLIHGFTGSPRELGGLRQYLTDLGIDTAVPTLPGHDTEPDDMLRVTWQDWFNCVKSEYVKLTESYERVFVCGQSMGGALALLLASETQPAGLVTLAAPVFFPAWQTIGAKIMMRIRKYRYKKDKEDVRQESAKDFLNSYRKYPYYAADQLFRLVKTVRKRLSGITAPMLIIHSPLDHTVAFRNAAIIYQSVSSEDKTRIDLKTSYHVLAEDTERQFVWENIGEFITTRQ